MTRGILSCRGGGERGLITCCCLIEAERQTGKPIRELFDMVAGTSTGALLAAALAVGIPAKDILPVYTERAPQEIFTGGMSSIEMVLEGHRYKSATIARVLRSVFGKAATWTLNDSPIRILITAVGVNRWPWYFVQDNPRNARTTGKLSLIDCAVASAAAPTYFTPWYVSPLAGSLVGWCFDGGVGVTGNPVYQACVEAFCYDDFSPDETKVLSLGTGYFHETEVNAPTDYLGTVKWTIDTLLSAPHDQQTQIVNRHYPGILTTYDWPLPHAIDMADMSAIPTLLEVGKAAAESIDWEAVLRK